MHCFQLQHQSIVAINNVLIFLCMRWLDVTVENHFGTIKCLIDMGRKQQCGKIYILYRMKQLSNISPSVSQPVALIKTKTSN